MPLGKRADCGDAKYAGVQVEFAHDIVETLEASLACGFDFLVAPLVHPRYRRPDPSALPKGAVVPPFTRSDLLLTSAQWSGQVVGAVSPWMDADSASPALRRDSEAALVQELGWAAHLTLQAALLPPPPQPLNSANYARLLRQTLGGLSNMALWVAIPATTPPRSAAAADGAAAGGAAAGGRAEDPWEWWSQLRFLCGHHPRLCVALQVGADLPPPADLERWRGEPLKAVVLSTSAFTTNKRGYPVLPRRHQELLADAFRRGVQVVLRGGALHTPPPDAPPPPPPNAVVATADGDAAAAAASTHPLRPYWEYLSYCLRKLEAPSARELMESGYRDFLQAPLQPLADHLESATYETFERDSTKYDVYEEAVLRALRDLPLQRPEAAPTVIMVVGAGRGPLVASSLSAARRAGRRVKVYAVEKNPNAVVTLYNRAAAEGWEGKVTVVPGDMREWEPPELADILVSELLGSFGDNELSPECLDGAQRLLRAGGVSIPQAYTSSLHPIASHKLWNDVKAYNDLEHFETPYVVKLFRYNPLAPPQDAFTFVHPNLDPVIDNNRYVKLRFKCTPPGGTVCDGFAGYFDAQLYKDVHLSIHPETHTPNMSSWFPIYFPVRQPFYVPQGAEVEVHCWRCVGRHKVWYEWAVTQPQACEIHNPNGRSYHVGL